MAACAANWRRPGSDDACFAQADTIGAQDGSFTHSGANGTWRNSFDERKKAEWSRGGLHTSGRMDRCAYTPSPLFTG